MNARLANGIKYLRVIISLVTILIIAIFFSGCQKESTSNLVICHLGDYSLYPKAVRQILPTFTIEQSENKAYYNLDGGAVSEAFDTQAVGALETGIAKHWYPHYLATVIIALDRDQTNALVTSWNDLFTTQEEVGFFDTPGDLQMLTVAMSFGLEGEDYSLQKAMELLALLYDHHYLKLNSFESPITICYDYQAAALIKSGRNIEIMVPTDGTFTYEKGLLSKEPLDFQGNLNQILLEAKLPLLDGQRDISIYPDEGAYATAVRVADYKHLTKTTRNVNCLMERRVY